MYDAICFTSPGGYPINEDAVRIIRSNGQFAAAVADGLGSHGGGDIASAAAVAAIHNSLPNNGIVNDETLNKCLETANMAVVARQKPGVAMKSTVVMLAIENGCAAFAHVGDSRGYYFHKGFIECQTMDHSVSQMAVLRGDITPAQIRFHSSRSQLLRALGADDRVSGEITHLGPLCEGDAFLLCSDGFWEYITEDEMEVDLMKSSCARDWLSCMLARIGKRVQEGYDNLSAIAMIYKGES